MEFVILKAGHPTWMSMQLPKDVAALLRYDPTPSGSSRGPAGGISFVRRGPGVVRVLPTRDAQDVLAAEGGRGRYLAVAHTGAKSIFNLPLPVIEYLGLQTFPRPPNGARTTDDAVMWFVPAPEYYEFRAHQRTSKGWLGPSPGGFAHVYFARSVLPLPSTNEALGQLEARIESEEWRPRIEALRPGLAGRR